MLPRHREQSEDRLIREVINLREQADGMPPGVERDLLICRARQAEISLCIGLRTLPEATG